MRIMTNTVVGSAIGGLVAGAVALGAAAVMRPSPAPAYGPDPNTAYAMTVANTDTLNNGASIQCRPNEEAVLRRAFVAGREITDVTCITRNASYMPQPAYAQPVGYAPAPQRDYAYEGNTAYDGNTVRRPAARARTVSQPVRERVVADRRESDRSWAKTAMIIGGSSGAGAGVGGLIAGKKGALIGAAVGGGAAAIYESRKR
jgi:hypothetical protein